MKKAFNVVLVIIIASLKTLSISASENCPLPTGSSNSFTGDPCHLAALNQSGSCINCTLNGLDNTTLTIKLSQTSNLSGSTLNKANLTNLDLTGVDFTGTTLTQASLTNCILDNANFQNTTDMSGINLSNTKSAKQTHFNNSSLYAATLSGNFAGAIFDGTGWGGATFNNSDFTGASFLNLITSMTQAQSAGQNAPNIETLDWEGQAISNVKFINATMNNAQFTNCVLNNVDFTGADLSSESGSPNPTSFANINNSQSLQKNNLSASNLANPAINFTNANLANASFSNANLNGIHFNSKDISGVDFSGAILSNVQFATNLVGTGLNFTGSTLQNVTGLDSVLTNAFKGTYYNCPTISFKNAIINQVHIGGTNNSNSNLGADFTNATFGPGTNISNINLCSGPNVFSNITTNGISSNPVILSFGYGLSPYNFANCNFNYTNFSNMAISEFSQTKCNNCIFNGLSFSNLDLTDTTFANPKFQNINVQSAKSFSGSNFCSLVASPLPGCKCQPKNKQYTAFTCTNA